MGETILDVKGLNCPLPVLRANRALRGMQPGGALARAGHRPCPRWPISAPSAARQEHDLLSFAEEAGVFSFTIRRKPEPPEASP